MPINSDARPNIDSIPNELLTYNIFSQLGYEDLNRTALTCKRWSEINQEQLLQRKRLIAFAKQHEIDFKAEDLIKIDSKAVYQHMKRLLAGYSNEKKYIIKRCLRNEVCMDFVSYYLDKFNSDIYCDKPIPDLPAGKFSPILIAALVGNKGLVNYFLASTNISQNLVRTTAMFAASSGDIALLQDLLNKKDNLGNIIVKPDLYLVYYAIKSGSINIVKMLLELKKEDGSRLIIVNIYHLIPAAATGNVTLFKHMSTIKNSNGVSLLSEFKNNILSSANSYEYSASSSFFTNLYNFGIKKFLAIQGQMDNSTPDYLRLVFLRMVWSTFSSGSVSMLKHLLTINDNSGVSICLKNKLLSVVFRQGGIYSGYPEDLQLLHYCIQIIKENQEQVDLFRQGKLHQAAKTGQMPIVKFLLGYNNLDSVEVSHPQLKIDKHTIDSAALSGNLKLLVFLLNEEGSPLCDTDTLDKAAKSGNMTMFDFLSKYSSDVEKTLLDRIIESPLLIKSLLNSCAESGNFMLFDKVMKIKNKDNKLCASPDVDTLNRAIMSGNIKIVKYLLNLIKPFNSLSYEYAKSKIACEKIGESTNQLIMPNKTSLVFSLKLEDFTLFDLLFDFKDVYGKNVFCIDDIKQMVNSNGFSLMVKDYLNNKIAEQFDDSMATVFDCNIC